MVKIKCCKVAHFYMVEYASVRIPKVAKISAEVLKAKIVRDKNFEKLEKYLKTDLCPLCNQKLKNTAMTIKFVKIKECPNCKFYKPTIDQEIKINDSNILNILSTSLLLSLGICLIADFLLKDNN